MRPRVLAGGVILGVLAAACSSSAATEQTSATTTRESVPTTATTPVPDSQRALADELSGELDAFAKQTAALKAKKAKPVLAGELLSANGNQGENLLAPNHVETDRRLLDALERIHAGGVTVDIPFPLLAPDFPRHEEYLAYYKTVAAEVRKRDMLLMVESQILFTGTPYSPVQFDYAALGIDAYLAGRTQQVVTIARELEPDYLAFVTEPSTDQMLSKLRVEPDRYIRFISDTIDAVGTHKDVKLGAGTGTWEAASGLAERIATETDVDVLDLHVYPLEGPAQQSYVQVATQLANEARSHHKGVVIGEAWLFKASRAELAQRLDFGTSQARNPYPFWGPLDARFVTTMARFARATGVSFVSYYWIQNLFAYAPADTPEGLSPAQSLQASNRAAAAGMAAEAATVSGKAFARAAR